MSARYDFHQALIIVNGAKIGCADVTVEKPSESLEPIYSASYSASYFNAPLDYVRGANRPYEFDIRFTDARSLAGMLSATPQGQESEVEGLRRENRTLINLYQSALDMAHRNVYGPTNAPKVARQLREICVAVWHGDLDAMTPLCDYAFEHFGVDGAETLKIKVSESQLEKAKAEHTRQMAEKDKMIASLRRELDERDEAANYWNDHDEYGGVDDLT